MVNLLLFLIGSVGITFIIVEGGVFLPFRDWVAGRQRLEWLSSLINCHQCCGFWIGFISGAFLISCHPAFLILCGGATSFLSVWAASYIGYLEMLITVDLDEE